MWLCLGLLLGPEAALGDPKNPSQDPGKLENTAFCNTAVALGVPKGARPCRHFEAGRLLLEKESVETGPRWTLRGCGPVN